MSSTLAPFGVQPSFKEGGMVDSCTLQSTITTAYGTAIYLYSPVKLVAGVLQAAGVGDATVGSFMGVEYDDAVTGRRLYLNNWPAAATGTNIVAYYTKDPYLTYEAQANGSIAQSQVGAQLNIAAPSGNTTTGLSTTPLDTATITTSANAQYRITGITPGPDNAFGDSFTQIQVQVSKHQFVAVVNAIA